MHTLIKNILDKGYCERPKSTLQGSISEQWPAEGMLLKLLPFKHWHGKPSRHHRGERAVTSPAAPT